MKAFPLSKPGSLLVNIHDVIEMLGISRSTVWNWVDQGKIPRPIKFAPKIVKWRRKDIEKLIKAG